MLSNPEGSWLRVARDQRSSQWEKGTLPGGVARTHCAGCSHLQGEGPRRSWAWPKTLSPTPSPNNASHHWLTSAWRRGHPSMQLRHWLATARRRGNISANSFSSSSRCWVGGATETVGGLKFRSDQSRAALAPPPFPQAPPTAHRLDRRRLRPPPAANGAPPAAPRPASMRHVGPLFPGGGGGGCGRC